MAPYTSRPSGSPSSTSPHLAAEGNSTAAPAQTEFVWKKRPKGLGLRRNHKISKAVAPKPCTEQPVSKSLCLLPPKPLVLRPQINWSELALTGTTVTAEELYSYQPTATPFTSWQSIIFRRTYSVRFDPVIDTMPVPEKVYMTCIIDMASREYADLGSFYMFLGFELRHPDLSETICLPYKPIDAITSSDLLLELESQKRSFSSLGTLTDSEFEITLCFVKQMMGSGKPAAPAKNKKSGIFRRSGKGRMAPRSMNSEMTNITPNQVKEYCLATAVRQGMIYLAHQENLSDYELEAEWFKACVINDEDGEHEELLQSAKDLLLAAGITKKNNFTIKDVAELQDHLSGNYQLVVFTDSHNKSPLYTGPSLMEKNIIALVCSNGHFEHIRRINQYVEAPFYCVRCNVKATSQQDHYSCPLSCRLCCKLNCLPEDGVEIYCEDCRVTFYSRQCMLNHKMGGLSAGRSRCQSTMMCSKCNKTYRDARLHKCFNTYCQHCKVIRPKGHQCTLALKYEASDWNCPQKRLFFHVKVENTILPDGAPSSRVVLVMAMRFCAKCRHTVPAKLAAGLKSKCANCSPDGRRLFVFDCIQPKNRNDDVMEKFLRWLVNRHHGRFACVTHDIPQACSDRILEYVTRDEVPSPKYVTLEGTRLKSMMITGSKTRIVDSKNFVPAAIDEFARSIGIPQIVQGEFPGKFIHSSNFDYVGPVPPLELFAKPETARAYHAQRLQDQSTFIFQDELLRTTYGELVQMSSALLCMESVGHDVLGLRIFEESENISRAALFGYRRNFMEDETLLLDRGMGTKFRSTYSMTAMKYLAWRAHDGGLPIDTAVNVGEYRVPNTPFHLDGFIQPCEKYPRGLGIDVKGCYWHAHGCTYVPQMVARRELRVPTIRANDKKREDEIRRHCDLEIVWECEIALRRMTNAEMDNYMNNCSFVGHVETLDAVFPLRKETIRLVGEADEQYELCYRDISGLPAKCLKYDAFPRGEIKRVHGETMTVPIRTSEHLRQCARGLMYCKVLPPANLVLPVLPYKLDAKTVYTLCRSCCESQSTSECSHSDDERALTGTWTTHELELALDMGYCISHVYGAQHWENWSEYGTDDQQNVKHGLFSKYIDSVLGCKKAASGVPASHTVDSYVSAVLSREGIKLDPSLITDNPIVRKIADGLLDLWNVFAERSDHPVGQKIDSSADLWKIMEDPTMQIKEIRVAGADHLFVAAGKKTTNATPLFHTVSTVPVMTSSHVRCRLYRAILGLGDVQANLMYMDDSCVIYRRARGAADPLNDLGDELSKPRLISRYLSPGPEMFTVAELSPNNDVIQQVKVPGFAKTGAALSVQIEAMERQLKMILEGKPHSIDLKYQNIERDLHYLLQNIERTLRCVTPFDSRVLIGKEGVTLPYGWRERGVSTEHGGPGAVSEGEMENQADVPMIEAM